MYSDKQKREIKEKLIRRHGYTHLKPMSLRQYRKKRLVEMQKARRIGRTEEILKMRFDNGMKLREIGDKYGITRERVRQIIKPFRETK